MAEAQRARRPVALAPAANDGRLRRGVCEQGPPPHTNDHLIPNPNRTLALTTSPHPFLSPFPLTLATSSQPRHPLYTHYHRPPTLASSIPLPPFLFPKAREWLPRILEYGNDTGGNDGRQLAFYLLDAENDTDLATTIQKVSRPLPRLATAVTTNPPLFTPIPPAQ